MRKKYILLHQNHPCALVVFDEVGKVEEYHTTDPIYTPYLGNCDRKKFARWWEMRAVPASRNLIKQLMRETGSTTPEEYLEKNLALSITDTYWVCPEDVKLSYEDVKFSGLSRYGALQVPYHNATSYDMNASLGGKMDKYWDLSGNEPVLVKESYRFYGQQAINEVFATKIHELQETSIPFVHYTATRAKDGGVLCKCPAFTSEQVELVPAYEMIESTKAKNDRNLYQAYIDLAVQQGIDRTIIQDFMDYQTLTDFLISNTDEHLLNFGLLRDPDTMQMLGPAPIFDSGNSMFFSEERTRPYTRAELLSRPITSFYQTEEKLLRNVQNKKLLDLSRVPSPGQVREFYASVGLPEEKAAYISQNYEIKVQFLDELQHGKKISLYLEKQKERQEKSGVSVQLKAQRFHMVAGIPGSGKQKQVRRILEEYTRDGYQIADSADYYPAGQADRDAGIIRDLYQPANTRVPQTDGRPSGKVVFVSPNQIREERQKQGLSMDDDLVFATVYARIRQAALNGDSIVYSATNLDAISREMILELFPHPDTISKELVVVYWDPEQADSQLPKERLRILAQILHENHPGKSEGWDKVTEIGTDPIRNKNIGLENDLER